MQLRENVVKCKYRVPWFFSQEIQQLLEGLLVIEPEKRMNIDAIGKSWMENKKIHFWPQNVLFYFSQTRMDLKSCYRHHKTYFRQAFNYEEYWSNASYQWAHDRGHC